MLAYDDVCRESQLPPLTDARGVLMLQSDLDGAEVAGIVAFFSAVWNVRALCRRGVALTDVGALTELVLTSLRCPWLTRSCATKMKRQRREDRQREPEAAPHVVIYRSDGASRGQGSDGESVAGWGAAVWAATEAGHGIGPAIATARDFLGVCVSNNVAEYAAILECFRRALHCRDAHVLFEVDSMLVARQLAKFRPSACRSENLRELHAECVRLCVCLSANGIVWNVRHIYREYNQTADALAFFFFCLFNCDDKLAVHNLDSRLIKESSSQVVHDRSPLGSTRVTFCMALS